MTTTGKVAARQEAFLRQRGATPAEPAGFAETNLARHRREQLHAYRARLGEQRDGAALAPDPPPAANWVPMGPIAVLEGQAESLPTVSGRVPSLAVSSDGRRVYAASANGGVWRSLDAGRHWEPMSDEFDLDPQDHKVDSLSNGAIALIEGPAAVLDRLHVGTGEGFTSGSSYAGVGPLVSTDGGVHWDREAVQDPSGNPSDLDGAGFFALAVDPFDDEHLVAATSQGLYRRIPDGVGGFVWRAQLLGEWSSVVATIHGGDARFIALRSGGTVRSSTTSDVGGVRSHSPWSDPAGGSLPTTNVGRGTLAASASDPPVVYAMLADSGTHVLEGVHRLDLGSGGPNWIRVEGVPTDVLGDAGSAQGFYDQALVVDPSNDDRFYIGGKGTGAGAAIHRCDVTGPVAVTGPPPGTVYRASSTLIGRSVHADVHALVFRPGSSRELWVGCDGGVFVTPDATSSGARLFEPRNDGLATLTLMGVASHPHDPSFVFCGVQDNGGVRYRGDEVWEHRLAGDGGATVVQWAVPAAGTAPPPPQRPLRLLNGYIRGDIRRTTADADRYVAEAVDVPLGSRPNPPGAAVAEDVLFYPPIVGVPPDGDPAHAGRVAFGSERPWVSDGFGDGWRSVPNDKLDADGSGPGDALRVGGVRQTIQSLCWASYRRLYIGTTTGHLFRIHDDPASGWQAAEYLGRPVVGVPVTSIAADPRPGDDRAVWLTLGGHGTPHHVWHYDHGQPAGSRFTAVSNGLLDTQHNTLVVDPSDPTRLYVGADIGVWRSVDAGSSWQPLSPGLPDAAVLQLELHHPSRLLRAATHGRGLWELAVDRAAHPAIELYVRANRADTGRAAAPTTGFHVTAPATILAADQSPDILVDAPDADGRYRLPLEVEDPARFARARDADGPLLAAAAGTDAVTHVFVQVHSLGVVPAADVRVSLLLAPNVGAPPSLPAGYETAVLSGDPVEGDGWRTVGTRTVSGVRSGSPRIVRFDVPSSLLPAAGELDDDARSALVAVLHHPDDPYPAAERDPRALSRDRRHVALRTVAVERARGRAAQPAAGAAGAAAPGAVPAVAPDGGPLGVSQLVPSAVAVLTRKRLEDAADGLRRKVGSGMVQAGFGGFSRTAAPSATERRVLALAEAARDMLGGGPTVPVAPDHPAAGLSRYALLGAMGFELPGYAGMLAPGGAWVADTLRRGTADPNRSNVRVPTSLFALEAGRLGLHGAESDDARARIRAFAGGLLAATAAGVVVAPQLRDLLQRETHRDWERWLPSAGARSVDAAIRERLLRDGPTTDWWPAVADVPDALWGGVLSAIEQTTGLPARRRPGFAPFEAAFEAGDWLTTVRLRNAYALFHESWGSSSWHWTAYWGLLAPVLLAPSFAMLTGRALPNAGAFFDPDRSVDERAVFELLTAGIAWGSVPPFVYSMLLWSQVDEHTEPFVNALVLFLARAALATAAFATAADPQTDGLVRWLGIATPLLATDVYAAIRAAAAAAADRGGAATIFAMQTIPALTGLATLGISGIVKAAGIEDGAPFWITWGLFTAGMLAAGIPVAVALADGGGWQSWFLRPDRRFPVLDSLDRARRTTTDPRALARVFDDSTLWADAGPALHERSLPSGARAVVRLWWSGSGTLDIAHDDERIVLRPSDTGQQTVVVPPTGVTSARLAELLEPVLAGLDAEPVEQSDPQYRLPWPHTVADPGDLGSVADAPAAAAAFQRVGTDREHAYLLRHAPRTDNATPAGLRGPAATALASFPVVPGPALGDFESSGLGHAADLAVLLVMGAAPTLHGGTVPVRTTGSSGPDETVGEVYQVFRHWNLDERRLNEWRMLVAGGGEDERPHGADPMVRPTPAGYAPPASAGSRLAAAMGWIPLWRAWLRVASDAGIDSEADVALAMTPVVTFPDGTRRRPTNAELSAGVRFLLDLPELP